MINTIFEDISEATQELFQDLGVACKELSSELQETITVKYLRPGGVAFAKTDDGKIYAILSGGNDVLYLNEDNMIIETSIADFLSRHQAPQLYVAAQKRLAVGAREIARKAHLEQNAQRYSNSEDMILNMLHEKNEKKSLDNMINERFGSFEWLKYEQK